MALTEVIWTLLYTFSFLVVVGFAIIIFIMMFAFGVD